VSTGRAEAMGWLRALVGVALIVFPGRVLRISGGETPNGTNVLLMRTIGIRDLVIGCGIVNAARRGPDDEIRRWTQAALSSDSIDVAASVVSAPAIGIPEAIGAAAAAAVFAAGDTWVLRTLAARG
jgi:hypothetical protein